MEYETKLRGIVPDIGSDKIVFAGTMCCVS